MNKKIKIALILLLLVALGALGVWKYVNKPSTDFSKQKAKYNFSFAELLQKIETDTASLKSSVISVEGTIKKIIKDSSNITLELGYDSIMSSVTCQIDSRHISDFETAKEGSSIKIKGLVSDISFDPESVFGNTVQLTYCSLNNK
jgi:hypothetical protein